MREGGRVVVEGDDGVSGRRDEADVPVRSARNSSFPFCLSSLSLSYLSVTMYIQKLNRKTM
jgi:hypothetical protein